MDRILKAMQKPTYYCKECGKKIAWLSKRDVWCTDKCSSSWHYRNKKQVMTYPNEKI